MGQFELIEYTPRAKGSTRVLLYGVPNEHGKARGKTLFKLTHYHSPNSPPPIAASLLDCLSTVLRNTLPHNHLHQIATGQQTSES